MSLCRYGHDLDAVPRAAGGRCRTCQRERQRRYRKTPNGAKLSRAHAKLPQSKLLHRVAQRTRRALRPEVAERDRIYSLRYQADHREHYRVLQENRRKRAHAALPNVPVSAALAILRQMKGAA